MVTAPYFTPSGFIHLPAEFVPSEHLHLFHLPSTQRLWQLPGFLVFLVDSTYKRGHIMFVVLWLISLSIMLSRSIHVVANSKISFYMAEFYASYITYLLHIYHFYFIHPSISGHLLESLLSLSFCQWSRATEVSAFPYIWPPPSVELPAERGP